jgi:hypothetical protein
MSNSIISIGLQGVLSGLARAADSVSRILDATGRGSDADMVDGIISLKQDELQIKASKKVIKTGEEMQDDILDILA